ncbi:MAG: pyridoxamine 5'-phosphate oxidase family protein [Pseudomonadota bacterium]
MNDPFHQLDTTLGQVWQRLARGTKDRRAATRHPTLATLSETGPQARTVVLRGVDIPAKTIEIHTDRRSDKVAELTKTPKATLHVWDAKASLQMRLRCTATLKHADTEKWAQIPETAQRVYGGTPAPGHEISQPKAHDPQPNPNDFTIIYLQITQIETLHLGSDLHRRARFTAPDWQGHWIAP